MKKILIIEDEKALAEMYKIELDKLSFKTFRTIDGEEGIKKAREGKPDLILLDLLLPKIQGREVLEVLKKDKKTKNIPIFILTNYESQEELNHAKEFNVDKYILKTSITPKEIGELVVRKLEEKKAKN